MDVVRPAFLPDPSLAREEMEALQRDLVAEAVFADDLGFDPAAVALDGPLSLPDDRPGEQAAIGDGRAATGDGRHATDGSRPVVAGVDQAFLDDEALSAAVAIRDGRVVERAVGRAALEIPYVPGLLSFREGGAIVDALESLAVDPDLLVLDGSGRIHFREAGIATHVGVLFDRPAVGVAKNLLCGTPRTPLDDPLPEGARVAIEANRRVTAPAGTVIGYALQSRQYPDPARRHVNPLYVSPGHRVSAGTAADLVSALCAGYKLPEPTRLADACVDAVKNAEI